MIERASPTEWGGTLLTEAANALSFWHPSLPEPPWLNDEEVTAIRDCSAQLVELDHAKLPFWAPIPASEGYLVRLGGAPSFGDDPTGWVMRSIVVPALHHHLAMLPSVAHADETSALVFADEVLQVATANDLRYIISVPLSGVYVDGADALSVGEVKVRSLSPYEQGAIFDERGGVTSMMTHFNEIPYTVLELHLSGPRHEQGVWRHDRVSPLTTALQLLGHQVRGRFAVERASPPWVFDGRPHQPLILPQRSRGASEATYLTAEDLSAIVTTAKRLERYHISEPTSARDLAVHRFVTGLARDSYADGVLDFTIALEALLLPYDENARRGDLGYRFRVHGAHYLSEHADDRHTLAKQLSSIYEMRSRLVHGAKYPDKTQIMAAHALAYDFARRGLLRAVREDFPTAAMFNEMVLS
ncbi:hypothetical protein [Lentzea sp. NPDC092896]|uniref:hypothetical protein n=1 Tax=Lentzea sp. NPDC092896 TaxID=3364127 RepID=UPI0037FEF6B8